MNHTLDNYTDTLEELGCTGAAVTPRIVPDTDAPGEISAEHLGRATRHLNVSLDMPVRKARPHLHRQTNTTDCGPRTLAEQMQNATRGLNEVLEGMI